MTTVLRRAAAGQRLSGSEALTLVDCADPRPLMPIAAELRDAAIASLAPFGERGASLAQLADFMVSRLS